jgi:hypothetical protein
MHFLSKAVFLVFKPFKHKKKMKKFLVTYHVPASEMAKTMDATPEQRAEGMKGWMDWAQRAGSHLVDMGSPLMPGTKINPDGSSKEATNDVSGYSIVEAEDMDHAKKLFEGHPHTNGWSKDATIEVHETMPIEGM